MRSRRSSSVSSRESDSGYSTTSDVTMASGRSRARSRSSGRSTSRGSTYSRRSTSRASSASVESSLYDRYSVCSQRNKSSGSQYREKFGRHFHDVKSTSGLTRVVCNTIAKLRRKNGCSIPALKKEIKTTYGLNCSDGIRRLNKILKSLAKQGTLIKTTKGYVLVPASQLWRKRRYRRRSHSRRRRRRRRRKKSKRRRRRRKKSKRRRRKRHGRKGRTSKRRRRRKHRRRRRLISHKRGGRRRRRRVISKSWHSRSRSRAVTTKFRRGLCNKLDSGVNPRPGLIPGPFPGREEPPRVPSRNASGGPGKSESRASPRLPSRNHSPGRGTPRTRSHRESVRLSNLMPVSDS